MRRRPGAVCIFRLVHSRYLCKDTTLAFCSQTSYFFGGMTCFEGKII
nr:MAG TPA: hypothetical protein [Caudoviricetes sp.]